MAGALWLLAGAPAAQASFGLKDLSVTFENKDGTVATKAGTHPFAMITKLAVNAEVVPHGAIDPETKKVLDGEVPEGEVKDLTIAQMPGFVGDQTAIPRCTFAQFTTRVEGYASCPDATAVGIAAVKAEFSVFPVGEEVFLHLPIYNLVPPPGVAAKFGFVAANVPITFDVVLNQSPPYNLLVRLRNTPQALLFYGSEVTLWGNPADPAHNTLRGKCVGSPIGPTAAPISNGSCPVTTAERPLLTLPRACQGPLGTLFAATSWQGAADQGTATTAGMSDCGLLPFSPELGGAQPTSSAARSPSGLDVELKVEDEGLGSKSGAAQSDIRKALVTLPEGMTANPSLAEGLNVCTEAQLAEETAFSGADGGCPNASKVGTVQVQSPLVGESIPGALYVAEPYRNPFGTLLALYVVIKNPTLGIKVVQPLKVVPDPQTGQLTTYAEELPQLPFSHFRLHFREGTRSPLVTPPGCGAYPVKGTLYPWSGGKAVETTSVFEIISGPGEGPCPSGGLAPFKPGLIAGTLNNAAGHFSPFNVKLTRTDSEQEITHFSIKLPPGVVGKLAGIPFCSDAQIAAAKAREGQPHGGAEELASPSCPAGSEVGRTLVGSGVGSSLTYVPGKVYLAGPYHGAPISIVAITSAVAGPFDLGTVVVREALKVNPETAEVFVDATGSDPIPHIIRGIPVHLRDIRVYVDRPEFVLNPTSCEPTSTASTVLGAGLDFASEADDNPVTVSTRFQAADCAALGFKPKLSLSLKGGTKRSQVPAFRAVLKARPGDANIAGAEVILPPSEILEQGHIKTICTRVQFNEGAGNGEHCPAGSVYGRARAVTPLLDEALEGPVFLRANGGERNLPDLVAALHGSEINIDLVGYIDAVRYKNKHGELISRIRNRFAVVPDAPVRKFVLEMNGGKKGLLVNSTDVCKGTHRANANFTAQNGKIRDFAPALVAQCKKKGKKGAGKGASGKRGAR